MHIAQDVATRNMMAFINRDPTKVSIQLRHVNRTNSGGSRWVNDESVPDEVVRFIPNKTTTEQQPIRVTPDGRSVMPGWMISALPDSLIKVGAILTDPSGVKYEIVYRSRVPSWRVVFEAMEDG